ncbi:MAG: protein translocase subunit SecF [Vicinamibacterales bacterium]
MRIFENANYNFIKWRWHAVILSIGLIWAGVATTYFRGGVPLGIDFTGGTVVVLEFARPVAEDAVRSALGSAGGDAVVQRIQEGAGKSDIMIRLPLASGQEQRDLDEGSTRIESAMRAANLGDFKIIQRDIVGPSIGKDLQSKGIWATLTALGGILLYVAVRFRITFAVGAIVATFHDILITLVFLSWFGYEISLNVIAAILTIAGYSVNDTIVVFDRVRENQRLSRREPLDEVVNRSVNQTLGRTIITSGTTMLAVLALFVLGGEVLRGFAFTMLIGIITGTYSTVFIAAAIAIILSRRTPTPTAQVQKAIPAEPRRRARA